MKGPTRKRGTGPLPALDLDRDKAARKFSQVAEAFSHDPGVTAGEGKGFGSGALKVSGKIFAMISSKGKFIVKLPKYRVNELVAAGKGQRFEPRPGRPMKEWIVPLDKGVAWVQLARETCEYVKRSTL